MITNVSRYTVNQARAIIRQTSSRERVKLFQSHPSPLVRMSATHRLVRGRRFTLAATHANFNIATDMPINSALQVPAGTLKSPAVMSLAERYGFPIEVVQATLEAKGGDEKAAARSLSAKKARAAQNR